MKDGYYVVRETGTKAEYTKATLLQSADSAHILSHPVRMQILRMLAKREMYPAEIASTMGLHEQKIYYHIRQLLNAGILTISERNEVRGTVAKKYRPCNLSFCLSFGGEWRDVGSLLKAKKETKSARFLHPFIEGDEFNATIVVGSPDPHGPHKARARDSHYAIELALHIGRYCNVKSHFSTMLDVDIRGKHGNLILVGGPVTNLLVAGLNEKLPVSFSDKKPYGLVSNKTGKKFTEETTGIIVKMKNPDSPEKWILVLAGIRAVGTKSAVLSITANSSLLKDYEGQEEFYHVVNGYDLDGDGRVDNVEILE